MWYEIDFRLAVVQEVAQDVSMKTKKKKEAKKKERLSINQYKNPGGSVSWRVEGYAPDGKRIRKNFSINSDAIEFRASKEKEFNGDNTQRKLARTSLSDEQVRDAENAFRHAKGQSLSSTVIRCNQLAQRVRDKSNLTLEQAVAFFERHYRPEMVELSIRAARDAYLGSRRGVTDTTLAFNSDKTKLLLVDPNKPVHEFTVHDVANILSRYTNPNSYKTCRAGINAFFNWAVRFKHCLENPCKSLDRNPAVETKIAILSLDEVKRLLKATLTLKDAAAAAPVSLLLFAGLRPSELSDLKPENVNVKRGTIRIEGGKLRRTLKRVVNMPPVLTAWLTEHPFEGIPKGWRYKMGKLKEATGAERWVNDILRHTSISFQLARDQDMAKVALVNGTSPSMIDQHYREVIENDDDVKAFWNLTPAVIGKAKIEVEIKERKSPVQWPSNRDLKKMIWKTPVSRLAKEMGVSDNAIRKHCQKEGIELPSNAHWQRVRRQQGG